MFVSKFYCIFLCFLINLSLNQDEELAQWAPDAASSGSSAARMSALAESMHTFNSFVNQHPRLHPVMLPLRDGLTVIRYSASSS